MLKEVRLFASINCIHIIRYNHSWLEVEEKNKPNKASNSINELDLENSETEEQVVELDSPFICFDSPEKNADEGSDPENSFEIAKGGKSSSHNKRNALKIRLYIQMELCKNTLDEYLGTLNNEYPDIKNKAGYLVRHDVASQIIQALSVIHQDHKLIHRDLSLRNVFIGNDSIIKIGDFGLATKNITKLTAKRHFSELEDFKLEPLESSPGIEGELTHGLGTLTFSSPEQLSNLPYDQSVILIYTS